MTERTHAFEAAACDFRGLSWCIGQSLVLGAINSFLFLNVIKRLDLVPLDTAHELSLTAAALMIIVGVMTAVYLTRIDKLFENPMWHRRSRSARQGLTVLLLGFCGVVGGGYLREADPPLGKTVILISWLAYMVGLFLVLFRTTQQSAMIATMFDHERLAIRARHVLIVGVIAMLASLLLFLTTAILLLLPELRTQWEIFLISAAPPAAAFGIFTSVQFLMLLRKTSRALRDL